MSIEELFLRQIDSVDGAIEVIVHPNQPMTCVSIGPFVWQVENEDRAAVLTMIGQALAQPDNHCAPITLTGGDQIEAQGNAFASARTVCICSGPVIIRLRSSTACLLVCALTEARQWQRHQLLAADGAEVATC